MVFVPEEVEDVWVELGVNPGDGPEKSETDWALPGSD